LLDELQNLAKRHTVITAVRGRGLLAAFDLPDRQTRDQFWKGAYELGLLVVRCGERSIRVRPVLDIKDNDLDDALKIIDAECRRLA
jgi:L-lysine 6-transaminase